jgi:hypothetical protein
VEGKLNENLRALGMNLALDEVLKPVEYGKGSTTVIVSVYSETTSWTESINFIHLPSSRPLQNQSPLFLVQEIKLITFHASFPIHPFNATLLTPN